MFIFPVQLTTCRTGNLTRLIHSLAICNVSPYIHTYIHTHIIVVDAVRETGETQVEREKNVEKKGLVQ